MWCVVKSAIFAAKCHSPNYSGLLIIATKPKVEEKLYTATLLFYIPQESFQQEISIHMHIFWKLYELSLIPIIQARMSVILDDLWSYCCYWF